MTEKQNQMTEQNNLVGKQSSSQNSLDSWQIVIDSSINSNQQQNQQAPKFTSEGKWSFQLKQKQLAQIHVSVIDLIKQDFGLQDEDLQISFKNQISNIQQGLQEVGIFTQEIQQNQWKQKFGFWEITDFRIDVKDGNTTIVDFKNQSHHFVLFYETSLKNFTYNNQNK